MKTEDNKELSSSWSALRQHVANCHNYMSAFNNCQQSVPTTSRHSHPPCSCRLGVFEGEYLVLSLLAFYSRPQGVSTPMSTLLESQCPSCHKQFTNESLVLWHMNNPKTSCQGWFNFLASISPGQTNHPLVTGYPSPTSDYLDILQPTHYKDIHPNIPSVFGSGPGFMNRFNANPHAEKQHENLYYPFSSKEEWSLTLWLLCSRPSIRAIDDFLALPIVSLQISDPKTFALLYNCKNITYPHGSPS